MVARIDITDDRYGRLVAIRRVENRGRRTWWLFSCDCGTVTEMGIESIRAGMTRSCGCLREETTAKRSIKHGHTLGRIKSPTIRAWNHAKGRCYNTKDARYNHYGARGIQMCDRWRDDFRNFLADMGEKPKGYSLERKDVHGNYEPNNCEWIPLGEQPKNKQQTVWADLNGQRVCLKDYARHYGISYTRLHALFRYEGYSIERARDRLMPT
jgi:hypothetical protein